MTQQSLIARLGLIAAALEIAQDDVICSFDEEPDLEVRENLRRDAKRIEAALTDLRDLIREAEGQEPYAYKTVSKNSGCEGIIAHWLSVKVGQDHATKEYHGLYTALGEKP